jgi:uncharacterized protein (TIGR02246 family)
MSQVKGCVIIIVGALLLATTSESKTWPAPDNAAIERAVLAVHAEMTRAGETADADRLFEYMLETDKGSIIQNGVLFATRAEALARVKKNLLGIASLKYNWKRQYVTVLSPESALLIAEGESVFATTAGETVQASFVQTVVFVKKAGQWRAIHAHQSSPR